MQSRDGESANLTPEAAISIVRDLSAGKDNYPFHQEGEMALARVLVVHCDGVTHAKCAVGEFETSEACPTLGGLRDACERTARKCRACGVAFWAHDHNSPNCKFLAPSTTEEAWTDEERLAMRRKQQAEDAAALNRNLMVPLYPGIDWQVCLQFRCCQIAFEEKHKNDPYYQETVRKFPEIMGSIARGETIEVSHLQALEAQMKAMGMLGRSKPPAGGGLRRLGLVVNV